MRSLIIADKQDITCIGIRSLTESFGKISSVTEVDNKLELIERLRLFPSSIIILDYALSDFSGANELLILKSRFPESDWILFSDELSDELLNQLVFGASSFSVVLKTDSVNEIEMAFTHAIEGERYLCQRIANHLLSNNRFAGKSDKILTNTEKEILKEIASGKSTKEIASVRNLSIHTVITHRKNIFRKLEVNNVHEATRYAIRAGIVDIADYYI